MDTQNEMNTQIDIGEGQGTPYPDVQRNGPGRPLEEDSKAGLARTLISAALADTGSVPKLAAVRKAIQEQFPGTSASVANTCYYNAVKRQEA